MVKSVARSMGYGAVTFNRKPRVSCMQVWYFFLMLITLLAMEVAVTLFHKHVMHGIGWGWHRSHHVPRKQGRWETNDLYAVVFTVATVLLFVLGGWHAPLWWIALGITIYGLLYGILHDVLTHKRIPVKWQPQNGYLRRLITAHRLHHAVNTQDGGVSYGFLYAPPVDVVRMQLRAGRGKG